MQPSPRWISIFGHPDCIMSDREGGVASEYGDVWAKGQHASTVERRNALLRDVLHKMISHLQLKISLCPLATLLHQHLLPRTPCLSAEATLHTLQC